MTTSRYYCTSPLRPEVLRSSRGLCRSPAQAALRRYYSHGSAEAEGRGLVQWCRRKRKFVTTTVIGLGTLMTIRGIELETVPFTNRTRFVIVSDRDYSFDKFKECAQHILDPHHPESVRVRLIMEEIVGAIPRSLADCRSDANEARHPDGHDWEVIVVKCKEVRAFTYGAGMIVVYTGMLDHMKTDDKIAAVLGHEVGHVIARHDAEGATQRIWLYMLQFAIVQLINAPTLIVDYWVVGAILNCFVRRPYLRRAELEADQIGMLLLGAAGFDPHTAPVVYESLGKVAEDSPLSDYLSTHPSCDKRSQRLSEDKVMEEAQKLYREVGEVQKLRRLLLRHRKSCKTKARV